jgi:hypothetical protein
VQGTLLSSSKNLEIGKKMPLALIISSKLFRTSLPDRSEKFSDFRSF